jgi:hypothetical protein
MIVREAQIKLEQLVFFNFATEIAMKQKEEKHLLFNYQICSHENKNNKN